MNIEDNLESLLKERLIELEKRIVAGTYIIYKSNEINDELNQYKLNNLHQIKYKSIINGENVSLSIDSYGEIRDAKGQEFEDIEDLTKLFTKQKFEEIKRNKTRVLRTILYAVFDNVGFDNNYTPKEVMNLMEKIFNITFDSNIKDKIFINKGTLSSVLYKIKKIRLKEYVEYKKYDYKTIKEKTTELIRDNDVNFNNLEKEELINLLLNYNNLKKSDEGLFNKYLFKKRDSSIMKKISENSEFLYPYLFRKLYNKILTQEYKKELKLFTKEKLIELCENYKSELRYDSFEELKFTKTNFLKSTMILKKLGVNSIDSKLEKELGLNNTPKMNKPKMKIDWNIPSTPKKSLNELSIPPIPERKDKQIKKPKLSNEDLSIPPIPERKNKQIKNDMLNALEEINKSLKLSNNIINMIKEEEKNKNIDYESLPRNEEERKKDLKILEQMLKTTGNEDLTPIFIKQ